MEKKRVRTLSLKKNEEQEIYDFVEMQTNLSDTLLYLIQKEIAENGVRDLQMHIPAKRNIASVMELLNIKQSNNEKIKNQVLEVEQKKEEKAENNISDDSEDREIGAEYYNSF